MNAAGNPGLERRAFHQAGHAVVAIAQGIRVERLSVVTVEGIAAGVQLAPLCQVIAVAEAESVMVELVYRYVVARLAGPVTEMIRSARLHRANGHTVAWHRWRNRWQRRLERQDDVDVAFAFAAVFGWSRCRNQPELTNRLQQLWKQTEALPWRFDHGSQVEQLASALLDQNVLTSAEVNGVIRPSDS